MFIKSGKLNFIGIFQAYIICVEFLEKKKKKQGSLPHARLLLSSSCSAINNLEMTKYRSKDTHDNDKLLCFLLMKYLTSVVLAATEMGD